MICTRCGYVTDPFDKECPRCHGHGDERPPSKTAPPPEPGPDVAAAPDKPAPHHANTPGTRLPAAASAGLVPCPYCAELIQPTAQKCRYCMEWLIGQPPANK